MVTQKRYTIISNKKISKDHYKMTLLAPEICQNCFPGQFISLSVQQNSMNLIRRPFCIYQAKNDELTIVYKVIGQMTRVLTTYQADQTIDVLGPLGTPIKNIDPNKKTALIAGGVGLASVRQIADKLSNNFDLFYGVKTKEEIFDQATWESLSNSYQVSTDDGTYAHHGFITELYKIKAKNYDQIFCCGPEAMMKRIFENCPKNCDSYFLLEETMACGIGVCMGCVCKTKTGLQRICKEGPVFKGSDLLWE